MNATLPLLRTPILVLLQVKPELAAVSKVDNSVESFARSNYDVSCEVAINEQVSQDGCLNVSAAGADMLCFTLG